LKKNKVSKKDDPNIPKRKEWPAGELGDFTTSLRVLPICALLALAEAVEAYPDEPLRAAVYRMAEKGVTRMPFVERQTRRLLGLISPDDLLAARTRHLEGERRREQTLKFHELFFWRKAQRRDCAYCQDERSFPLMPKIG
jgi:hypothetical protein